MVRGFARYLHAIDPTHQIPPAGLLPRGRRPAPFLYTEADIAALMAAARRLEVAEDLVDAALVEPDPRSDRRPRNG